MVARTIPKPNPFLIDHVMHDMEGPNHSEMNHPKMDHASMNNTDIQMMNEYDGLRAIEKTSLPTNNPNREVVLELTGNMERYVWSFNNKTLSEEDTILIRKGENVRFKFVNRTMMHHPLHLHGHFFRVLQWSG